MGKKVAEGLTSASTGRGDVMTIGQAAGADRPLSGESEQGGGRKVDVSVTIRTDGN
ncbi:MAG: hypothetical protein PVH30_05940 [Desulfobacterales bacterium]